MRRSVFFISDGTGITAETLGHSLLAQFGNVSFDQHTLPYVGSPEKAREAVVRINEVAAQDGIQPIIIDTIVDKEIRSIIASANACMFDVFETFVGKLETLLGEKPMNAVGKSHSVNTQTYKTRIDAVHFALDNDDGARTRHYDMADIILIGVSRSGKTPTCIYLALQFGIRAANYPLTEEDLDNECLPKALKEHRSKLFGLMIDADRLTMIRNERKANSRYASPQQVMRELRAIESIYIREGIPFLDVSEMSVEEIATRIIDQKHLKRRISSN
ncbi:MAG TPA: pyruvate, water dikinase regulatory protein [Fluviicoccus sp.]|nr:pyruvate, water dikinase regulatory protein [Fluviicoccus sp.]